jgi:hypothetical protein
MRNPNLPEQINNQALASLTRSATQTLLSAINPDLQKVAASTHAFRNKVQRNKQPRN